MKCSRRKAPMGTTPLRECRRRNRNEVPSPARSGATPDLILGETLVGVLGLAVDATMTAPYLIQCANESLPTKTNDYRFEREGKSRWEPPGTANDTFLGLKTLFSRWHTIH